MPAILDSYVPVWFWNGRDHTYSFSKGTNHLKTGPFKIGLSKHSDPDVFSIYMFGIQAPTLLDTVQYVFKYFSHLNLGHYGRIFEQFL